MAFNDSEQDEQVYLGEILEKLRVSLAIIEQDILDYADKIVETKRFAWENVAALDAVERAAYRIAVNEQSIFGEQSLTQRTRLKKQLLSPYFGRIDFVENTSGGQTQPRSQLHSSAYYIGIHSYFDKGSNEEQIIDWRAPLSSIFYDFETGPAAYLAPEGEIAGDILRKRQYKIRGGVMEYMLESALNIGDDILQQELSKTSDDKMKNIVATIQKEQNQIIRNDSAKVLIIQGAAGSGKTSIALHRVAFLLYRHKRTLRANDVLILSPNKVFGSYISNVLPELGEENIPQLGFDALAKQFLGKKIKFESFSEQVAGLIEDGSAEKVSRIRYKADIAFVTELQAFLQECDDTCFVPVELWVEGFYVSAEQLAESYDRLKHMPIQRRLQKMVADCISAYERTHMQPLSSLARRQIKERIIKMFPYKDARALYRQFYKTAGREGLYVTLPGGKLEYADVFPLAWLTLCFEGVAHRYGEIKHLLVDEMQDYTPVQYAFIALVFHCNMTILGDSYQSVNPYSSSSLETIRPYFKTSESVELVKSYRSTLEIVNFAQSIRRNDQIIPIERHGDDPLLTGCTSAESELRHIKAQISAFRASGYNTLGILCKSQAQADALHQQLDDAQVSLLSFDSDVFIDGVIITCCHMAKGLEFDQVIVQGCTAANYQTELDRSLLYIACTRAMHVLELTFSGAQSSLIVPGTIWYRQQPEVLS